MRVYHVLFIIYYFNINNKIEYKYERDERMVKSYNFCIT